MDEKWAKDIDVASSDWRTVHQWVTSQPDPYRGNRAEHALHDAMVEIERLRAHIDRTERSLAGWAQAARDGLFGDPAPIFAVIYTIHPSAMTEADIEAGRRVAEELGLTAATG